MKGGCDISVTSSSGHRHHGSSRPTKRMTDTSSPSSNRRMFVSPILRLDSTGETSKTNCPVPQRAYDSPRSIESTSYRSTSRGLFPFASSLPISTSQHLIAEKAQSVGIGQGFGALEDLLKEKRIPTNYVEKVKMASHMNSLHDAKRHFPASISTGFISSPGLWNSMNYSRLPQGIFPCHVFQAMQSHSNFHFISGINKLTSGHTVHMEGPMRTKESTYQNCPTSFPKTCKSEDKISALSDSSKTCTKSASFSAFDGISAVCRNIDHKDLDDELWTEYNHSKESITNIASVKDESSKSQMDVAMTETDRETSSSENVHLHLVKKCAVQNGTGEKGVENAAESPAHVAHLNQNLVSTPVKSPANRVPTPARRLFHNNTTNVTPSYTPVRHRGENSVGQKQTVEEQSNSDPLDSGRVGDTPSIKSGKTQNIHLASYSAENVTSSTGHRAEGNRCASCESNKELYLGKGARPKCCRPCTNEHSQEEADSTTHGTHDSHKQSSPGRLWSGPEETAVDDSFWNDWEDDDSEEAKPEGAADDSGEDLSAFFAPSLSIVLDSFNKPCSDKKLYADEEDHAKTDKEKRTIALAISKANKSWTANYLGVHTPTARHNKVQFACGEAKVHIYDRDPTCIQDYLRCQIAEASERRKNSPPEEEEEDVPINGRFGHGYLQPCDSTDQDDDVIFDDSSWESVTCGEASVSNNDAAEGESQGLKNLDFDHSDLFDLAADGEESDDEEEEESDEGDEKEDEGKEDEGDDDGVVFGEAGKSDSGSRGLKKLESPLVIDGEESYEEEDSEDNKTDDNEEDSDDDDVVFA